MAKLFKTMIRRTVFKKDSNLVSLDDWYETTKRLLGNNRISGILDAGASNGRIALKLLDAFPDATAYAFEPNPRYRDELEALARENTRFSPHFNGLANHSDSTPLFVTENIGSSSLYQPSERFRESHPDASQVTETVQIDIVRLDEWLDTIGTPPIEVMKLDIQGGELAALQGAEKTLQRSTLLVYTEVLFNAMYDGGALFSDIDQYLRSCGFVLYNLYKPRCDANGVLHQADAIYVHAEKLKL